MRGWLLAAWGLARRAAGGARRHPAMAGVLGFGVAVRVVASLGFWPAVWFDDAFEYVGVALRPEPYLVRPSGYSLLLWALGPLPGFAAVILLQHLTGPALGVAVYALLRRRFGASQGKAALFAAPVVLDAYQIFFEHTVLSDTVFTLTATLAVIVVLWEPRLSARRALVAGGLVAAAALTRSIGLALGPLVILALVLRRDSFRAGAALVVAAVVPLAAYAGWFASVHGRAGLTGGNGVWLWARVAPFADCRVISPPADEAVLCPGPGRRTSSPHYMWGPDSPLTRVPGHPVAYPADRMAPEIDRRARGLALHAIAAQPGDYALTVFHDLRRTFAWQVWNPEPRRPHVYNKYSWPPVEGPLPGTVRLRGGLPAREEAAVYGDGPANTRLTPPFTEVMQVYERFVFLPGTVLGVLLVAALAGGLRRRHNRAALFPALTALALITAPPVITTYDPRYQLVAVPLACIAAGALRRAPTPAATRPSQTTPTPPVPAP
ncbi:hypothetical protein [Bailinhaonella thermotolerans]|uniref:Glycosyltransferase RgtA/B/C/D-like domain-containing protein n=1 Tax=Bailinhaonella thermotolerans TaxID=1070861 RepID=A0A3A4ARJ8_9ACTN|nr:hypothetical protein [Bailinhaonella thermotolerans]RJL31751.1 hypothetical protein D5H75_18830 [Bailinhaonella thermotolerans]